MLILPLDLNCSDQLIEIETLVDGFDILKHVAQM